MNKNKKLVEPFLSALGESHMLKSTIDEYEKNISILLADPNLSSKVNPKYVFDVLQSLEGLQAASHVTTQKLLTVVAKMSDDIEVDEIKVDSKIKTVKNTKQKNNKKENPLINNAIDYLNKMLDDRKEGEL